VVVVLSFGASSCAMNRDGIFNDDQLKDIHPIVQYVTDAQKAVSGLLVNLKKEEDRVKTASDGYWQTVGKRGPFTIVGRTSCKPLSGQERQQSTSALPLNGEYGKKIVLDMPAKL